MLRLASILCLAVIVIHGSNARLNVPRFMRPRLQQCCGESQRTQILARLDVLEEKMDEIMAVFRHKAAKKCPSGWTTFRGSCYMVSGNATSWIDARADCQRHHADLVTISSGEENAFVLKFVEDQSATTKLVWIGFYRTRIGALFAWADGTTSRYTNWSEDEPNYPMSEHCALMYTAPSRAADRAPGTWNNYFCGGSNSWPAGHVCELRHGHGEQ